MPMASPYQRRLNQVQLLNNSPENKAALGLLPRDRVNAAELHSVSLARLALEKIREEEPAPRPERAQVLDDLEVSLANLEDWEPEKVMAKLWGQEPDGGATLLPENLQGLNPVKAGKRLLENLL